MDYCIWVEPTIWSGWYSCPDGWLKLVSSSPLSPGRAWKHSNWLAKFVGNYEHHTALSLEFLFHLVNFLPYWYNSSSQDRRYWNDMQREKKKLEQFTWESMLSEAKFENALFKGLQIRPRCAVDLLRQTDVAKRMKRSCTVLLIGCALFYVEAHWLFLQWINKPSQFIIQFDRAKTLCFTVKHQDSDEMWDCYLNNLAFVLILLSLNLSK